MKYFLSSGNLDYKYNLQQIGLSTRDGKFQIWPNFVTLKQKINIE